MTKRPAHLAEGAWKASRGFHALGVLANYSTASLTNAHHGRPVFLYLQVSCSSKVRRVHRPQQVPIPRVRTFCLTRPSERWTMWHRVIGMFVVQRTFWSHARIWPRPVCKAPVVMVSLRNQGLSTRTAPSDYLWPRPLHEATAACDWRSDPVVDRDYAADRPFVGRARASIR